MGSGKSLYFSIENYDLIHFSEYNKKLIKTNTLEWVNESPVVEHSYSQLPFCIYDIRNLKA